VRICLVAQPDENIIIVPLEILDMHRLEVVSPIPRDSLPVVIVGILDASFTPARLP
jgi:hypothetical protein